MRQNQGTLFIAMSCNFAQLTYQNKQEPYLWYLRVKPFGVKSPTEQLVVFSQSSAPMLLFYAFQLLFIVLIMNFEQRDSSLDERLPFLKRRLTHFLSKIIHFCTSFFRHWSWSQDDSLSCRLLKANWKLRQLRRYFQFSRLCCHVCCKGFSCQRNSGRKSHWTPSNVLLNQFSHRKVEKIKRSWFQLKVLLLCWMVSSSLRWTMNLASDIWYEILTFQGRNDKYLSA